MSRRSKTRDDDVMRTQDMSPKGQKLRQTLADLALELEDRPVGGKDRARYPKAAASPKRPRGRPPKSAGRSEEVRLMSDFDEPRSRPPKSADVPLMSDFAEPRRPSPKRRTQSSGRAPVRIVSSDWDDDRSYGRSNPSLVGAAETSYDASMDPEGAAMLHRYLEENYTRTTLDEACDEQIDVANDGRPDVAIWVKTGNKWRQMDRDSEVMTLWAKRLKNKPGSVCQSLVKDLLGLSERDYENLRHKFDQRTGYIEGVYKAKPSKAKEVEKFAVVVKMPSGMSVNDKWVKAGLGGLAGLATVGAGLATAYAYKYNKELGNLRRNEGDWKAAVVYLQEEKRDADRQLKQRDGALAAKLKADDKYKEPAADKAETERIKKKIETLDSQIKLYKFYEADAALATAEKELTTKKAAVDAKSDESTRKAVSDAESYLTQTKARSLRAYYDATVGQESLTKKINKLLDERSALGDEYEKLITSLTTTLKEVIIGKKIAKGKLEDVKKEAEQLFNLGDKSRAPVWSSFWITPIAKLKEDSPATTILRAIRAQFPEYDLLEKTGEQFKEGPVLQKAKALALQYGLEEPNKDGKIDEFISNLELVKYKSLDSKLANDIKSYVSGAPKEPINVDERIGALSTDLSDLISRSQAEESDKSTLTQDAKDALDSLATLIARLRKIEDAAQQGS